MLHNTIVLCVPLHDADEFDVEAFKKIDTRLNNPKKRTHTHPLVTNETITLKPHNAEQLPGGYSPKIIISEQY